MRMVALNQLNEKSAEKVLACTARVALVRSELSQLFVRLTLDTRFMPEDESDDGLSDSKKGPSTLAGFELCTYAIIPL